MNDHPASEFSKPSPFRLASMCAALAVCALAVAGCDGGKSAPAPTDVSAKNATAPATAGASKDAAKPESKDGAKDGAKDEVKLSKENWPNGTVKYSYEMRKSSNGKWARNGIGRAYYASGELEREGMYKNNVRVGRWTYYLIDGKVDRIEDRGADGKGGTTGEPPLP